MIKVYIYIYIYTSILLLKERVFFFVGSVQKQFGPLMVVLVTKEIWIVNVLKKKKLTRPV